LGKAGVTAGSTRGGAVLEENKIMADALRKIGEIAVPPNASLREWKDAFTEAHPSASLAISTPILKKDAESSPSILKGLGGYSECEPRYDVGKPAVAGWTLPGTDSVNTSSPSAVKMRVASLKSVRTSARLKGLLCASALRIGCSRRSEVSKSSELLNMAVNTFQLSFRRMTALKSMKSA
jgi:hypothetical protein